MCNTRNTFSYGFYARASKANKHGLAPVELSFVTNGKRVFINLPFKVSVTDWQKKRRPKEIEDYLNAQRVLINRILAEMAENGIPVTAENLRQYYRTGGVKTYTAEDLFTEYLAIQKARVPKSLTQGVYRKYELVRDIFFSQFDKSREVTEINNSVVRSFFTLLDNKYDNSTAVGYKTKFKAFIVFALDNNKLKINPFQGVKITKEKKEIDYLTQDEIKLLMDTEFDNESLNRVRDAAIFQLFSGLSFADVAALQSGDLKEEDGMYYISKNRVKTGTPFLSVVLPQGVEIYKRYDGHIPLISNQKYNLHLKAIQSLCGIKKNLHTHIFRHTYCTMLLNNGVPIKTVSRCAGHKNSKITETFYAHLEDKTVLREVSAAFA